MIAADVLIEEALAGHEPSDEDLARLAAEPDDEIPWNPDRIEAMVIKKISNYRTRRRQALLAVGVFVACAVHFSAPHDPLHSAIARLSRRAGEEVGVRAPGLTLPSVDLTPVVVLIDDTVVREVGWPIPQRLYAQLLDRLGAARVVAFDVPFVGDETGTVELADAIRRHERVVLGAEVGTRATGRGSGEWPREVAQRYGRAPAGSWRIAWADLPDSRLLVAAAGMGTVGTWARDLVNFRGRAVPTLPIAAMAVAGMETAVGAAGAEGDRRANSGGVDVLSVNEVFATGARARLAGRVVYVGISAELGRETVEVAGKREPRVVVLARR